MNETETKTAHHTHNKHRREEQKKHTIRQTAKERELTRAREKKTSVELQQHLRATNNTTTTVTSLNLISLNPVEHPSIDCATRRTSARPMFAPYTLYARITVTQTTQHKHVERHNQHNRATQQRQDAAHSPNPPLSPSTHQTTNNTREATGGAVIFDTHKHTRKEDKCDSDNRIAHDPPLAHTAHATRTQPSTRPHFSTPYARIPSHSVDC